MLKCNNTNNEFIYFKSINNNILEGKSTVSNNK